MFFNYLNCLFQIEVTGYLRDKILIQNFNNRIKDQIRETIMLDEKLLYGVCVNVNVTIRSEDGDDDLTFFDKMTTQVEKFQAT